MREVLNRTLARSQMQVEVWRKQHQHAQRYSSVMRHERGLRVKGFRTY